MINPETGVIGSILIDGNAVMPIVTANLVIDDFQTAIGQAIFNAAQALYTESAVIDAVTIGEKIKESGGEIPATTLVQYMDLCPTANNIETYCDLLTRQSMGYRLRELATQTMDKLDNGSPAVEVCGWLKSETDKTADRESNAELLTGESAINQFLAYRDNVTKGKIKPPLKLGIADIDNILGGLVSQGFYILAARPGVGKSTMAIGIAENVAKHIPVLFVSLEMSAEQIQARRISIHAGLDYSMIYNGELTNADYKRMTMAAMEIGSRPFHLKRKPGATVAQIGFLSRQIKNCGLIIVDYLGLITPASQGKKLYEQVTETSRSLKMLAMQLKIPILCLAQLNREVEGRKSGRPAMSDLRDSGAIEQDADGIILLHGEGEILEVIVAKNRHKGTGKCELTFYKDSGRVVQLWRG